MRAPRWVHRLYAALTGYFWLPCPVCDRWFGGHEATGASVPILGRPYAGWLVCPRCDPTQATS